jgi:excisionase family DNA binding protein
MEQHATLLTVPEAAARLRQNEQTVRRRLREGSLPGVRVSEGARSAWRIPALALEHMLEVDAHHKRMQRQREAGQVVGRGEEFLEQLEASPNSPEVKQAVREIHDRRNLFDRVERDMYADPAIRQRFESLDEEARFEEEARELARRIHRAERLRDRALEILDEED